MSWTYLVQDPQRDADDWTRVEAYSANDAAEKYCEESDPEREYVYARGADCILVKESEDAPPQAFAIEVEHEPHYYARPPYAPSPLLLEQLQSLYRLLEDPAEVERLERLTLADEQCHDCGGMNLSHYDGRNVCQQCGWSAVDG